MTTIREAKTFDDISKGLVLLEVYKQNCEPCEQLVPILQDTSQEYGTVSFFRASYATEEIIRRLPEPPKYAPMIYLLKDGQVVDQFTGAKSLSGIGSERAAASPDFLRRKLDSVLSRYPIQTTASTPAETHPVYSKPSLETRLRLSENSLVTLRERYLKKDEDGRVIEAPESMFTRVAANIAEVDKNYGKSDDEIKETQEEFYEVMTSLQFLPNSPTLMNAGRDLQQLSACFVLPIDDSIESIFGAAREGALVHKSGGGTGYSFSRIRPRKSRVKSTSGIASGPVSFLYVVNTYTDVVKQGGTRRGANMGILRVDHPDIQEFIHAKGEPNETNQRILNAYKKKFHLEDGDPEVVSLRRELLENQLSNLNISVGLTGGFMEAYLADSDFDLIDPNTKRVIRKVSARATLDEIADQSWKSGDPGVIFLDRINEHNPTPQIGEIESTNPCGEQPLLPYESCNLGSINLSRFVTPDKNIDYPALGKVVHTAVHLLDNIIDINRYPIPEIEKMTKANRKIGLGVMGFADMLAMLKVQYGSEESLRIAEDVMKFIREEARNASVKLAEERGVFPNWKDSIYDPGSQYFQGEALKLRNATLTTVAPTGTLSMIADCESGIEPTFSLAYTKTVMDGKVLHYRSRGLEYLLSEEGFDVEGIFSELEKGEWGKFDALPEEIKSIAVTSMELEPEQHIRVQAAFQRHTDNAVSKTINMPESATREDIKKAYLLAHGAGCKGVTIYRDKSKDVQVLEEKVKEEHAWGSKLPKERIAIVRQEMVGEGKRIFVIKSYWGDRDTERLINYLKGRKDVTEAFVAANFFEPKYQSSSTALLIRISKDLRKGIPVEEIATDLLNLPPSDEQGYDTINGKEYVNRSVEEAIGRALIDWEPAEKKEPPKTPEDKKYIVPEDIGEAGKEKKKKGDPGKNVKKTGSFGYCKECGKFGVERKEGCDTCIYCGNSIKGCP